MKETLNVFSSGCLNVLYSGLPSSHICVIARWSSVCILSRLMTQCLILIFSWWMSSLNDIQDLVLVGCDWLLSMDLNCRRKRSLFLRLHFCNHFFFKLVRFCGWYRFISFIGLLDLIRLFPFFSFLLFLSSPWYLSLCYEIVFKQFLFSFIFLESVIAIELQSSIHSNPVKKGLENNEIPLVNNLG